MRFRGKLNWRMTWPFATDVGCTFIIAENGIKPGIAEQIGNPVDSQMVGTIV